MGAAFILASFISCSSGARKTERPQNVSLVGKWEGVDRTGKLGAFHFSGSGDVTIVIDGKPLGSPEVNGFGSLKFTIDYLKDPAPLDIIGIDQSGSERGRILMIVRFITNDKIKIRTYFNEERPENFDNESVDDTIILDRMPD